MGGRWLLFLAQVVPHISESIDLYLVARFVGEMSELVEGARLEIVYPGNWVGGSNPPLSAVCLRGDVAQLGERLVRNEEVGGSIPLISTNSAV